MKTIVFAVFLTLILVLLAITSFAQPREFVWDQTFGGDQSDFILSMDQTTDGGFILTGGTMSFGAVWVDLWLVKTDASGNLQWSVTFGGDGYDQGNWVQQTEDGGYIVAGYTSSFGTGYDVWLIKTNDQGAEEWSQTYNHFTNDFAYSVQQTTDTGYILTGYVINANTSDWDVLLIKTDPGGDETWWHTYGGNLRDWGNCVIQNEDGEFVVAGVTESLAAGSDDVMLLKTDSSGNELWMHAFGGPNHEYGYEVQQTSDEGYILAGYTTSFGAGTYDAWLIKTDSDGVESWNQTYGGEDVDEGLGVQQTPDGGYVMSGFTRSSGEGGDDVWVVQTDSGGGELWSQTFGGTDNDYGEAVLRASNGLYYVAGTTSSFGAGSDDGWLICLDESTQGVTTGHDILPAGYLVESVYPNPFNAATTVSIALPALSDLRVSVFNLAGQEVAVLADEQFSRGRQQFTFDANGLTSGIYFVQATVPGRMNQVRKIVLLK